MIPKVFVSADGLATFVCPACKKPVRADVSEYRRLTQAVRIRAKCPCGHRYTVDLERRRHFRLAVNLPGIAFRCADGRRSDRTPMVVKDISREGVMFQVSKPGVFSVGETLLVEFNLDDAVCSLIRKEAVVCKVSDRQVGAEFGTAEASDPSDQALGFYFIARD